MAMSVAPPIMIRPRTRIAQKPNAARRPLRLASSMIRRTCASAQSSWKWRSASSIIGPTPLPGDPIASACASQRQGEGEAGALPRGAVDADVAAHGPGEPAGDVEAEAGAAGLGRVDALELVEDAVLV